MIEGSAATDNHVENNLIGTDVTGINPVSNTLDGIKIHDFATSNTIGGDSAQQGNVISYNGGNGILLDGRSNTVANNRVGTTLVGSLPAPNTNHGIEIGGASNNIGTTLAGVGGSNIIAFNGRDGIRIRNGVLKNAVLGNAVSQNGGLGIDHSLTGVTQNDQNFSQSDFPTVKQATVDAAGKLTVSGELSALSLSEYHLEFFVNDAADKTGYGEGGQEIQTLNVTTDVDGIAEFSFTNPVVPIAFAAGQYVTATATKIKGSSVDRGTSEFSKATKVLLDSDGDGVSDKEEGNRDGNDDKIADKNQPNVASVRNAKNGQYVTIAAPLGKKLSGVRARRTPAPGTGPPGHQFPFGVFDFKVTGLTKGEAITVTITHQSNITPSKHWNFGREGANDPNPNDHWYDFSFNATTPPTGARFVGNQVILHLQDGGRGDHDYQADGVITDPGGPTIADPVRLDARRQRHARSRGRARTSLFPDRHQPCGRNGHRCGAHQPLAGRCSSFPHQADLRSRMAW